MLISPKDLGAVRQKRPQANVYKKWFINTFTLKSTRKQVIHRCGIHSPQATVERF